MPGNGRTAARGHCLAAGAVFLLPLSSLKGPRDLGNLDILKNSVSVSSLVNIVLVRPGPQEVASILIS